MLILIFSTIFTGMSVPVENEDACYITRDRRLKDGDDDSVVDPSSSKGRVRKSKKPEIQIYQPRPLREKLRSQSSDPSKSPQELTSPGVKDINKSERKDSVKREGREQQDGNNKAVQSESPKSGLQHNECKQSLESRGKPRNVKDTAKRAIRKNRDINSSQNTFTGESTDGSQVLSPDTENAGKAESSLVKAKEQLKSLGNLQETKMPEKSGNRVGRNSSFNEKSKFAIAEDLWDSAEERERPYKNPPKKFVPKADPKRFVGNMSSEKKYSQAKERSREKPMKNRKGWKPNYQEDEVSRSSQKSESIEIKTKEFYPSPVGKKEGESIRGKSDNRTPRQTHWSESGTSDCSEKRADRPKNDRRNKKYEESPREEHWGKSHKGNPPAQRGRKTFKDDGFRQDQESTHHKEANTIQSDVAELAAKVDKISFEKSFGSEGNLKKESQPYGTAGRFSVDRNLDNKEMPRKDEENNCRYHESLENTIGEMKSKPADKCNKAKSYANARESRKKMNANKPSPNNGKQNIEVTVDRDGQGRTTQIKRDKISRTDVNNQRHQKIKKETERNWEREDTYSDCSKIKSYSSKLMGHSRIDDDCEPHEKGLIYAKDIYEEKGSVEPMNFIEIPDEDWDAEVDREMSWCNERERSAKAATWEDEKPPWMHERDKKQPERQHEAYSRRAESPGHRGGLIQLPATFSTPECTPRGQTFSEQAEPAPVMQKHLYNPNNPSKPVPVVPSARDLPLSRDGHRENAKNFEDSGASSFSQGHSGGGHIPDSHSPKIDPTLLYNIQKGECDISYYVNSNQLPIEFRRIMDIRRHLQQCYKQLLISDIRMCQENIEGALWKSLYYTIIEKLREYISREPHLKDRSLATLRMLVDEGQQYLQELLEALQREYNFTLEDHLEEEGMHAAGVRTRGIRMPLMSAQKLLLSLGDLARYKENYSPTPNYTLAKK